MRSWIKLLVPVAMALSIGVGIIAINAAKWDRYKQKLRDARTELQTLKVSLEELHANQRQYKLASPATVAWESYLSQGPDHPLGVPVVYAADGMPPPKCYLPRRKGLTVRYLGNHFQAGLQKDILYRSLRSGKDDPLVVDIAVPGELAPGEEFTILADEFYDFAVGSLFVKVLRHKTKQEGFLDYTTLIGETALTVPRAGDEYVRFQTSGLYNPCTRKPETIRAVLDAAQGKKMPGEEQDPRKINPVIAGQFIVGGLVASLAPDFDPELRKRMVATGEAFFKEYGFPMATTMPDGSVAWPHPKEWPIHWKIKLSTPWYSGYGNAIMGLSAAVLHHHTGKPAYKELADKAVQFLRTPMAKGGTLYYVGRYPHLAEYAYPSPAVPNIRVLDGEMIAAICIYDLAVLFKDTSLLEFSMQLTAGLAVDLDTSTTADGKIINARYPWLVDDVVYLECMQGWARALGEISKDAAFFAAAERWNLCDATWR